MITLEQVDREIAMLTANYRLRLDEVKRSIGNALRPDAGISHHLGHNLGSQASELQMMAGQIEQMRRVRLSFIGSV